MVGSKFNPADIIEDGRIDFYDFSVLAAQWMNPPGVPSADIAPFGGDGIVTIWTYRLSVRVGLLLNKHISLFSCVTALLKYYMIS